MGGWLDASDPWYQRFPPRRGGQVRESDRIEGGTHPRRRSISQGWPSAGSWDWIYRLRVVDGFKGHSSSIQVWRSSAASSSTMGRNPSRSGISGSNRVS